MKNKKPIASDQTVHTATHSHYTNNVIMIMVERLTRDPSGIRNTQENVCILYCTLSSFG